MKRKTLFTVHLSCSEGVCNPRYGANVNHFGEKDGTSRHGRGYKPRQSTVPERLQTLFTLLAALGFALILTVTVLMSHRAQAQAQAQGPGPQPTPGLPIMFVENAGQFEPRVRFRARGSKGALSLAQDGMRYTLVQRSPGGAASEVVNLDVTFVGANPHPEVAGFDRLGTTVSYFSGVDPAGWRANVPAWRGVRYSELYPGVDLELSGEGGRLAQRLVVRPGADLGAVRLRVAGAESLVLEGRHLRLTTRLGDLTLPLLAVDDRRSPGSPIVHATGERTFEVSAPFAPDFGLDEAGQPGSVAASAQMTGTYTLDYSTFLGGTTGVGALTDEGHAIAVDSAGAVYVTGWTYCNDFFTTGAYDFIYNGAQDVFVAKLSADGSALEYATYLGGGSNEEGRGIAVDSAGNAYVTGWATVGFPTTGGAFNPDNNGGSVDAFVTKLNPTGSGLVYSTFLGGSGEDKGHDIALDSAGHAYVTGEVNSSDFPTTTNAYDTAFSNTDAFLVKVSDDGSSLDYATYLGGGETDAGYGVAVGASGDAYVTGRTSSSDFPTTTLALDTAKNNGWDAFVTVLHPAGGGANDLLYSTYLGGEGADEGAAVAVQPGGTYTAAYVTGYTYSSDFPTTTVGFDGAHNGLEDGFVAKVNPAGGGGSDLIYATYLGGQSHDWATDIAVDAWGAAYVVGWTQSYYFPTTPDAYQSVRNGLASNEDAFVTKLSADGAALAYSTFLGTPDAALHDFGRSIAVDGSGNACVTGYTDGADFPTTAGAYDTTHNGDWDAFVTRFRWLDTAIYLPLVLRNF